MKVSLATAKPQSSSGACCVCRDGVRHPKLYFGFSDGAKCMDVSISETSRRTKCHWDPHYEELPWGRCHRISASFCLSSRQISWGGNVRHRHTGTVSTAVCCGAVGTAGNPRRKMQKRKTQKKWKGERRGGKKLFFSKLGCPHKQSNIPKETHTLGMFRPLKTFGIL